MIAAVAGSTLLRMGHVCGIWRPRSERSRTEHPITALLAVIAMLLAILLISIARFEVHGTGDLEAALIEPLIGGEPSPAPAEPTEEVDAALVTSRWATGLSP